VKKSRLIGCLIGLTMILPLGVFGQFRFGYVNTNRIVDEFEEFRDAQAMLEKRRLSLEAEYIKHVEQADSLQREYERQRLLLSNEMIQQKEQEIINQQQIIQRFQQEKFGPEGEIYVYQAQLMAPILNKINAAVRMIGEEQSFDLIVDAAAGILYAPTSYDITDDVVAEMRRSTNKE